MRWLLAGATVIALALATALMIRTVRSAAATTVTVASPGPPAAPQQKGCPDATLRPALPLAEAGAAPLQLVVDPSVKLLIDGEEPGPTLLEGVHELVASAPGQKSASLKLQVEAFTPVLLDVRPSGGAVTVLMVGGRCASCAAAVTTPELKYTPSTPSDLGGVARALAKGDWPEGALKMRGIAPSDREGPEPTRLLAVLYAFVGRPTLVREQLERLEDKALEEALVRRDALEELKPVRQLQTATARWNATTERFQRLTDRFVTEAPKPLTELTRKFGELSKNFASAEEKKDAIGCEAALDSANAALSELVMGLRAMRPEDCSWQRRVTEAL